MKILQQELDSIRKMGKHRKFEIVDLNTKTRTINNQKNHIVAETTANKGNLSTLQIITKQLCGKRFSGNTKANDKTGNNLQKEDQVTKMNEHFFSVLNTEHLKTQQQLN